MNIPLITVIVSLIVFAFAITVAQMAAKEQAIAHHAAYFGPTTGEFLWNDEREGK